MRVERTGGVIIGMALVVLVLAVVALSGLKDDSLAIEQAQYCRMVHMHKSDPNLGWPDFNNTYDQYCTTGGTVKEAE